VQEKALTKFIKSISTMNSQQVGDLIEKYYLGETTAEEDQQLSIFLANDKSDLYQSEKAQFLFYKKSSEQKLSKLLKEQIEKKINQISTLFPIRTIIKLAAILVVALGLGYYFVAQRDSQTVEIITQKSNNTKVHLPDGSTVWINKFSKLTYPRKFDKRVREVYLEGQAYFEVTKDIKKPFVVHSLQATTKVVGTSFNIRSFKAEENIELTVYTGKVFFGSDKKVEVLAGSQVIFKKKDNQLAETRFKNLNSLAWKNGELKYEDTEFRIVFQDLERYFNVKFEIQQKQLLHCHFSGTFFEPKLEEVLNVIKYVLAIEYKKKENTIYISGQSCGKSQ
jgi:ferric-dicitrate binding protein FerR (iron transport regulator)